MEAIVEWFKTCKPEPKEKDITTQIGVHLEEVEEMLTVLHSLSTNSYGNLVIGNAKVAMSTLAYYLKEGVSVIELDKLTPELEEELLDSILDQVVTGIGVATLMGQDYINGLVEVNRVNDIFVVSLDRCLRIVLIVNSTYFISQLLRHS
jgi:hypothetical protein